MQAACAASLAQPVLIERAGSSRVARQGPLPHCGKPLSLVVGGNEQYLLVFDLAGQPGLFDCQLLIGPAIAGEEQKPCPRQAGKPQGRTRQDSLAACQASWFFAPPWQDRGLERTFVWRCAGVVSALILPQSVAVGTDAFRQPGDVIRPGYPALQVHFTSLRARCGGHFIQHHVLRRREALVDGVKAVQPVHVSHRPSG